MAIYNPYSAYYSDKQFIKPINYITSKSKANFEQDLAASSKEKSVDRNQLYLSVLKKCLRASYGKAIELRSSIKFSPKGYVK